MRFRHQRAKPGIGRSDVGDGGEDAVAIGWLGGSLESSDHRCYSKLDALA